MLQQYDDTTTRVLTFIIIYLPKHGLTNSTNFLHIKLSETKTEKTNGVGL